MKFTREEMATLANRPVVSISDEEVCDTLLREIMPGGAFFEYIDHAQLGLCLGDTLFVHGAVTAANAGFVPSTKTACAVHDLQGDELRDTHTVQQWIDRLNAFKDACWRESCANPRWNADRTKRAGEGLMAYAHRRALRGRTAMVESYYQEQGEWHGNLKPVDPWLETYLGKSGLRRVVVGHKPFGDSPTVMRSDVLEILNCDTSFSDPSASDNRGQAASEVCIIFDGDHGSSQSHITGSLCSGGFYGFA